MRANDSAIRLAISNALATDPDILRGIGPDALLAEADALLKKLRVRAIVDHAMHESFAELPKENGEQ